MTQTCHTGITWGTVGSPPSVSLLFPARGSAQSEPGGWSNSRPLPGTHLPGTEAATAVSGRRTGNFGPTQRGLGGDPLPGPPSPRSVGSDSASAETSLRPPPRTLGSPTSPYFAPGRLVPYLSSAARTLPITSGQAHGMAGISC